MVSRYLSMQIGCIECGVSSYPTTKKEAIAEAEKHPSTWDSEGGEGHMIVIDLEKLKVVWEQ